MIKVSFNNWNCYVKGGEYTLNGRKSLELYDLDEECFPDLVAIASVNLPNSPCDEDQIYIKTWSENTGIDESLIKAGVIEECLVKIVHTGFCQAYLFNLTELALRELFNK